MAQDDLLFSTYELRAQLEGHERKMLEKIDAIGQKEILGLNVEELCDHYEQEYTVAVPKLDEGRITVEQAEAKIDVRQDRGRAIFDRSQPFYITGTGITFYVPFEGDANLFQCRASTYNWNPPRGAIRGNEVVLAYARTSHDADAMKAQFQHDLSSIWQHLGWLAADVGPFNDQIRDKARNRIEARREKALKDQGLVATLGYPLRRREDAPTTYVVPTTRKKAPFPRTKEPGVPPTPEPGLAMAEYEHILSIIENMVAVIERSPHAFATMREEDLRQHFLVQLNAQYEGQATGETFNYEGKTDILVRAEGRNIFIAECKFWKGPRSLSAAIDQLLGYATWRDTMTAIILFNRTKNLSSVLKAIPDAVRAHANFVREFTLPGETRFRFVLSHRDDPEREVTLTVLVFDIPASAGEG